MIFILPYALVLLFSILSFQREELPLVFLFRQVSGDEFLQFLFI